MGERSFDSLKGVARFHYRLDQTEIVEEFCFPVSDASVSAENREAIEGLLGLLHVLAGVSYYKAGIPDTVQIPAKTMTAEGLALVEAAYTKGLGEFAYENQVIVKPRFVVDELRPSNSAERPPGRPDAPVLVAVGGGKDSCVALEAMREMGAQVTLASVGDPTPIRRVVEVANLPHLVVRRTLDPALRTLNENGAWNGHVPVTSIVSTALGITAALHGLDAVVMANERSANIGNVEYLGTLVNHQWSKSHGAEQLMQAAYASTGATFAYFSVLRAFSELEISRRFAALMAYHPVFTSCNRAFVLDESRRAASWCGDCPKCRFVFLSLAPWMKPTELVDIFAKNLLDDSAQIAGFSALMGIGDYKPFECVGEVEESQAAFVMLERLPEWRGFAVVRWFENGVRPTLVHQDELVAIPFEASAEHSIPECFQGVLQ